MTAEALLAHTGWLRGLAMRLVGDADIADDLVQETWIAAARLYRVEPGGPAAVAGLHEGDVVIAVDGAPVTELSPRGIWFLVAGHPPGTAVKVTVRRGDRTVTANVVLGSPDCP